MGAKLKMQEDWASPTWASQRAWLPPLYIVGGYDDIIGPWRMDYSYPVKDAEPSMIKNFKSPWSGVNLLTQFTLQDKIQQPYNPGDNREIYLSGVIYDPTSTQYDSEGNVLPPYGYVAWNRLAADLNHLKEFVGKLTVRTQWSNNQTGTIRYVDTVVTEKSINNDTDTTVFTPTGDFVTVAGPNEGGFIYDITIASS